MSDLVTKLTYLNETKNQIKEALGTNDDTFRNYVSQVNYENSYLAKLMANQKTANAIGTELSLADSADMYANVLDANDNVISGVTEQETREGYNLVNLTDIASTTVNGLTYYVQDNVLHLNGEMTDNCIIWIPLKNTITLNGTYTHQVFANFVAIGDINCNYHKGLGDWTLIFTNVNVKNTNYKTEITSAESTVSYLYVQIVKQSFSNKTLKFQLAKDSDTTKPYEQYGATPSPDYPSEIECVTGTQEISFSNNDNTDSNLHTLHLGDIELYGNDIVRDTLKVDVTVQNNGYKKVDKLYKVANWGKVVLNGSNYIVTTKGSTTVNNMFVTNVIPNLKMSVNHNEEIKLDSDYFKSTFVNDLHENNKIGIGVRADDSKLSIGFGLESNISTIALANSWLSTHNTEVVYQLKTPTLEEITDTTLIADIESFINSTETYLDGTNIDSNAWLDITYAVDKDKLTSASVIDDIATASIDETVTEDVETPTEIIE